jgi:hypothetical protein
LWNGEKRGELQWGGKERRGEEREEAMVSDESRGHMREKLPQLKGGE